MSNKKLTPCRSVGLSRKRSTGITLGITSETVNNRDPTEIYPLVKKKTSLTPKSRSADQNLITPCRRVGLSRKRKFSPFLNQQNIPMVSPEQNVSEDSNKAEDNSNVNNENNIVLDVKDTTNCTTLNSENILEVVPQVCDTKIKKSKVPTAEKKKPTKKMPKPKIENVEDTSSEAYIETKKVKFSNEPNSPIAPSETDYNTFLDKVRVSENFNNTLNNKNQFIKVSYKTEDPSSDSEPLINIRNKSVEEGVKKNVRKKFVDDDDDFETVPLSLSRQASRTDVLKSEPKNNNFKKSTSSSSSNSPRLKNCSVKLHKIKEATVKSLKKTIECTSDDDFDTPSPIPKEEVKKNIEDLEKEIEEKRRILDQLNRAKSMRKLHDLDELKELTLRWKNGCKIVLSDLLVELNRHAFMSMEMLQRKFNIPPDFFPPSQ